MRHARSISTKLFIITAVLLIVFISLTMYFQSIFFEDFYTSRKTKRLETNVLKFNALYSHNYLSSLMISANIKQFEQANNCTIVILNKNGKIKYTGSNQALTDNSRIDIMTKILMDWFNSPEKLNDIISSKKTYTTQYNNTDYGVQNIVCVSPVVSQGEATDLILAVSSLQPIEEAASIIQEFYVYIFLAAIVVIILLSFIYSNMISKPLIKLNRSASRMAQMDFSVPCPVSTEDEMGNLAKTLNFLSINLDRALRDLKSSNQKLQEDIEKERHLERLRKDFIAGVSHELKTPIALISGYAEGIKDNVVDGEDRDFYVDVILDEAQKMSNLVSDMLDLSQLESGTFKLKPEVFDISDLLSSVLRKHTAFMNTKNITLQHNISGEILVTGDITRIEQVITNFITNAIRHTPQNGFIRVLTEDKKDDLYIEIENTGEQIEPGDLKNIWDKFYKIDKSRTRDAGGTGLGLSIVKNILLLHQSVFGVKNTESGVSFYFTLKKFQETD